MFWRVVLLAFGVFTCATAVIMIKMTSVDPVLLASYRQLVAAGVLAPLLVRDLRRHRGHLSWAHLRRVLPPAALLAVHFVSWNIGARQTLAANASLIVNLVPIVMPFLLHWMIRERLTAGEWFGTAAAMGGAAVLFVADYHVSTETFVGDAICFASMLAFSGYMICARRNRDVPSVWLYVVPIYFISGGLCFLAGLTRAAPLAVTNWRDAGLILGLAIVPTVMGHSILNASMRRMRGQFVSIAVLGQFVFAGILAYFLLNEAPAWTFYPAGALVVTGAILAIRATPEESAKARLQRDSQEL